ncbi:hypothetical protein [Rhizobium tumorigenes]|uniref:Cell envelope integrity protein TolA n=1 Tax=Rhizobium tumorigenes TaxID=2041385 RepID=A0AAF1KJL2_9HYPH|nr:hypothetical protein [Rhizobium tumorigenes]WFR96225.1 hypothetical protein PR017_03545 [Rhizobium tumorigenes]
MSFQMNTKSKLCLALVLSLVLLVARAEARPAMLKQSTIDGVMRAIIARWNLPSDLAIRGLRAEVRVNLNTRGEISGKPAPHITGGTAAQQQRFAELVTRTILQAAPFTGLPLDKYKSWKTLIVRFEAQAF